MPPFDGAGGRTPGRVADHALLEVVDLEREPAARGVPVLLDRCDICLVDDEFAHGGHDGSLRSLGSDPSRGLTPAVLLDGLDAIPERHHAGLDDLPVHAEGKVFLACLVRGHRAVGRQRAQRVEVRDTGLGILRRDRAAPDVATETHDHPHHRGLWFTHSSVNGVDFWTETGKKVGKTVHTGYTAVEGGPFYSALRTTTDWITADGRRKLAEFGIAPPGPARHRAGPVPLTLAPPTSTVRCPHCGSTDTELLSQFGATACKALRRCRSCAEPFEHIKEL